MKAIDIDVEVNGVIEGSRRTFAESPNDILRRLLLPLSAPGPRPPLVDPSPQFVSEDWSELPALDKTRTTGRWNVEFRGRTFAAPNLRRAYHTVLLLLGAAFPDFLENFAEERGRARRFVARKPADLYLATPSLAKKHAAPLKDGWYFDTNLSTDQVARRVRVAARICGLRYGSDLRVLNNFEEI